MKRLIFVFYFIFIGLFATSQPILRLTSFAGIWGGNVTINQPNGIYALNNRTPEFNQSFLSVGADLTLQRNFFLGANIGINQTHIVFDDQGVFENSLKRYSTQLHSTRISRFLTIKAGKYFNVNHYITPYLALDLGLYASDKDSTKSEFNETSITQKPTSVRYYLRSVNQMPFVPLVLTPTAGISVQITYKINAYLYSGYTIYGANFIEGEYVAYQTNPEKKMIFEPVSYSFNPQGFVFGLGIGLKVYEEYQRPIVKYRPVQQPRPTQQSQNTSPKKDDDFTDNKLTPKTQKINNEETENESQTKTNVPKIENDGGVKGQIKDAKTKQALDATINIYLVGNNTPIITENSENGLFKILGLKPNANYSITVEKIDYLTESSNFNFIGDQILLDFELKPIEVGASTTLSNIFFESGSATLTNNSNSEVERLVDFLNENKSLEIEVSGHTDNIGGVEANLKLSKARAQAVIDQLIKKGINKQRLVAIGLADARPIATNNTDEGRQANRRVEIKVLKK